MIKYEIGNINIQHTDTIEINTDIHLPLKDDKLAKLQENDPHMKQLRETVGKQKFGPKHIHDGKQHPKKENLSTTDSCTHP